MSNASDKGLHGSEKPDTTSHLSYTESPSGEHAFLLFDSCDPEGELTVAVNLSADEDPFFVMTAVARDALGDMTVIQCSALPAEPEHLRCEVFADVPKRRANSNRRQGR